MAEVHIRLSVDPKTHKKTIIVSYQSDASALPIEHDEEHRRVVDQLLEQGIISAQDKDLVQVERIEEKVVTQEEEEPLPPVRESLDQES